MSAQHHYVTSAYLDGFLSDKQKMLYVYTRNRDHFFRVRPDKVARIRNYYSREQEDGTIDDKLESMLQKNVEDPGLAVIRKLNAGKYGISREARAALAFLLAIQEYRVPWMRNHTEELIHTMQQKFSDKVFQTPGLMEQYLEETQKDKADDGKRVTADGIRQAIKNGDIYLLKHPSASLWAMGQVAELLTNIYYGMHWAILEGQDLPFLVSDCPVHRYFLPIDPHVPYRALMDMRVQVRFPLSRSRMLVLTPDLGRIQQVNELMEKGKKDAAAKLQGANSQIHVIRVTNDDVEKINAHTISMAARIVLAPSEMPEIVPLFRGECQNVRNKFSDVGDALMVKAEYPQTTRYATAARRSRQPQ